MKTRTTPRLASLAAGAWLTLLAGGLCAPPAVQAGCTHFVVARGHGSVVNELELLSGMILHRAGESPASPIDRPSPCAGLTCARNPMPPMAPAPSGSLRADVWGCLSAVLLPAILPWSAALHEGPAGAPLHAAFPPERPPRPA